MFRILLAFVPYLVVLAALAAAGFWYAFWIVAGVSLAITIGAILMARMQRRTLGQRVDRMTGRQRVELIANRWWLIGLGTAMVATAAFLPGLSQQAWWVIPVYAVAVFVVVGFTVRIAAVWVGKYEEEIERFTGRGSSPRQGSGERDGPTSR